MISALKLNGTGLDLNQRTSCRSLPRSFITLSGNSNPCSLASGVFLRNPTMRKRKAEDASSSNHPGLRDDAGCPTGSRLLGRSTWDLMQSFPECSSLSRLRSQHKLESLSTARNILAGLWSPASPPTQTKPSGRVDLPTQHESKPTSPLSKRFP
ncbi:hypothetical protein ACA910_007908 [Epithemia clementina (nom. ined.)]